MSSSTPPRSSSGIRRARGPPGGARATTGTAPVADARRALITARYQTSAQIRKRRKEEILLEKRRGFGGGSVAVAASGAADAETLSSPAAPFASAAQSPFSPGDDAAFQHSLEQFLQNAPSLARLEALVGQGDGRAVSFLQRWLVRAHQDEDRQGGAGDQQRTVDRFLENLRTLVVMISNGATDAPAANDAGGTYPDKGRRLALNLVEALVSTAAPTMQSDNEDLTYYSGATGRQSLGWSCAIAQRGEAWFPTLVALLPLCPSEVGSILSHLYQDASTVLVTLSTGTVATARSLLIPQYWPNIVAALSLPSNLHGGGGGGGAPLVHTPEVARLASVILQSDATTPGMQFLHCLPSLTLAQLLHDPLTAVSAAWMLEGLTRREDAAVEQLCRDEALVGAMSSALQYHATIAATPTGEASEASILVLLPTLRTVGNIVTACDGRLLALFENVVADVLGVHLANIPRLADEVLWVMGCCLVDAGKPNHVATSTLAPRWVPPIVSVLTEEASSTAVRFEVKRQALASLWIALSMPPDVETFEERSAIQANLDLILLQHVWNRNASRGPTNLVDTLVQLAGVSDVDTVICALRVLQRSALVVASERDHLRSRHVIDRLEEVHDQRGALPAGDLASNLLELLQDDDEDEDEMEQTTVANSINPAISNGGYAFGLPVIVAQHPASPHSSAPHGPTTLGRGRGRPVPSWMEQRNV